MDETTLATVIEELPSALAVWHEGPAGLPRLLAMCTLHRLQGELELSRAGAGPGSCTRVTKSRTPDSRSIAIDGDMPSHPSSSGTLVTVTVLLRWCHRQTSPERRTIAPPPGARATSVPAGSTSGITKTP